MLTGSPGQGHVARGAWLESSAANDGGSFQLFMCEVEFPKPRVISEFRDEEGPNLRNTSLTANTQRHCAY